MDIFPFASSSDGNSTFIKTNGAKILIDCGVSLKSLLTNLTPLGIPEAIFITHEHSDHIKGIGPVGRRLKVPIYIHEHSYTAKQDQFQQCSINYLTPGQVVKIGDLTITPFSTKHDCRYSFGFVIEEKNGPKLCYMTDTGMVTKLMLTQVQTCNTFFIEADYDEEGLQKYGEYTEQLKERIASNFGHLSNTQAIELVKNLDLSKVKKIIFGHISPRTNSPEILKNLIDINFPNDKDKFVLAPLATPIEIK